MRLDQIIWGATAVIVGVAVATKTNIIKNIANKVSTRGQDSGYPYEYGYGYPCTSGFDPVTELQDMQLQSGSDQQVTPEQARKNTETHHEHRKKQHSDEQQIYAQIECPEDPNTLPCGSNCYKGGQLWKTVCTEEERQALFPGQPNEETPSPPPDYTIHYNPWFTPSPYYDGQEPQPQQQPTESTQNNIHPTTPEQNLQDQFSQYNPYQPSYLQRAPPPTQIQWKGNAITYLDTPWIHDNN